jgi:hypothetical protein
MPPLPPMPQRAGAMSRTSALIGMKLFCREPGMFATLPKCRKS